MPRSFAICLHHGDAVAVMASTGVVGQPCDVHLPTGIRTFELIDPVPFGHKVAIEHIAMSQPVLKYGQPIGIATAAIPTGSHVHTHNLAGLRCDVPEPVR